VLLKKNNIGWHLPVQNMIGIVAMRHMVLLIKYDFVGFIITFFGQTEDILTKRKSIELGGH